MEESTARLCSVAGFVGLARCVCGGCPQCGPALLGKGGVRS